MKNNTFKRVMAGTLAVLTVAAYVPANVGGFLTGSSAIVASADNVAQKYSVTWTDAAQYLTKYTEDYEDAAQTDVNIESGLANMSTLTATEGSTLTFNSKVPLKFETQGAYLNGDYVKYNDQGTTKYAKPVVIGSGANQISVGDAVESTTFTLKDNYYYSEDNTSLSSNRAFSVNASVDVPSGYTFYKKDTTSTDYKIGNVSGEANKVYKKAESTSEDEPANFSAGNYFVYNSANPDKFSAAVEDQVTKAVATDDLYAVSGDNYTRQIANGSDYTSGSYKTLQVTNPEATDFKAVYKYDIYSDSGCTHMIHAAGADFVGNLSDVSENWYAKVVAGVINFADHRDDAIKTVTKVALYTSESEGAEVKKGKSVGDECTLTDATIAGYKKVTATDAVESNVTKKVLTADLYQVSTERVIFENALYENSDASTATTKKYTLRNGFFQYNGDTDAKSELVDYANTEIGAKRVNLDNINTAIYQTVSADVATHSENPIAKKTVTTASEVTEALKTDATKVYEVVNTVANAANTYTYTYKMGNEPILITTEKQKATINLNDHLFRDTTTAVDEPLESVTVTDGSDHTATATASDAAVNYTDGFVVNDTVKVTSAKQILVKVNDGNNANNLIAPTTTFKDGVFTAEFTMPTSSNDNVNDNVTIDVYPVNAAYTYTTKDNTVLVSGGAITNAEIAALDVTSLSKTPATDEKPVVVTEGKEVANNQEVTIKATKPSDLLCKSFEVTCKYNSASKGDVITTAATGAGVTYSTPGTYEITMTVTGKDDKKYNVTRKFTIAAKTALKAENVKLDFSKVAKGDNPSEEDTAATDTTLGAAFGKTGEATVVKLTEAQTNAFTTNPYEFKPVITLDGVKKEDGTGLVYGTDYEITGYVSGSTLDKVYTFTVKIYNSEFGGTASNPKTFDVSWKVSSYEADAEFKSYDKDQPLSAAKEDVDALSDTIFNASANNSVAKANQDKVTYQYVEGIGASVNEDELDEKIDGLPTAPGKYTVYLYYNEELKASIVVNITQYSLFLEAASKEMAITYGDTFKTENYKLVDADGKTNKKVTASDIQYTIKKAKLVTKNGVTELEMNEDGIYQTDGDVATNAKDGDAVLSTLPAGTYIVTFSATSSDAENYTIGSKQQVLTVAKKAITADMITIAPISYNGKTHDIVKTGTVSAYDPATKKTLKVKIKEGTQEKAIGAYKATVALDTTTETETQYDNANYTGTAQATWHIVYPNATTEYQTGLKWDDSRTTLYDNGNIHVELNRNANDKIVNSTNEKAAVVKYGVIIEKNGKIAAPATYGVDYSQVTASATGDAAAKEKFIAERELQLGNGYTEGGYTDKTEFKASENQTYKANIKVADAQTGIWARPYILLESGEVAYGDVKFIRLEEEAKDKLNLSMPVDKLNMNGRNSTAIRRADLETTAKPGDTRIKGGYDPDLNKYYAYANFTDLETAGFTNVLEVADFGVVVDKTGKIAASADPKDVKETLVLKNGFIEGHYNKANTVLKTNEYAASITPKDSVTGVWVRPYLDLGNGLIVYGDPQYFNSASEYYAGNTAPLNLKDSIEETGKLKIEVTNPTMPKVANAKDGVIGGFVADDKVKVVKAGVVVDKNSAIDLIDVSELTGDKLAEAQSKNEATLKTELIIRDGIIKGTKSTGLDAATWKYNAQLTPAGQNVYIRSYVIYDIDGVQVTVYGTVETVTYNPNTKKYVVPVKG